MVFKHLCVLVPWTRVASALEGLIITISVGSGCHMFSDNILLLCQQDSQLVPYFVKWQLAMDRGLPRFLKWSKFPRIYGNTDKNARNLFMPGDLPDQCHLDFSDF